MIENRMKLKERIITFALSSLLLLGGSFFPSKENKISATAGFEESFEQIQPEVSLFAEYSKQFYQAKKLTNLTDEILNTQRYYLLGSYLNPTEDDSYFLLRTTSEQTEGGYQNGCFDFSICLNGAIDDEYLASIEDARLFQFVKTDDGSYQLLMKDPRDEGNPNHLLCYSLYDNSNIGGKKGVEIFEKHIDDSYSYYNKFNISFIDNQIKISLAETGWTSYSLIIQRDNAREGYAIFKDTTSMVDFCYPSLYEYRPTNYDVFKRYYERIYSTYEFFDEKEFYFGIDTTHDNESSYKVFEKTLFTNPIVNGEGYLTYDTQQFEYDTDKNIFNESSSLSSYSVEKVDGQSTYRIKLNSFRDNNYLGLSDQQFLGYPLLTRVNKQNAIEFNLLQKILPVSTGIKTYLTFTYDNLTLTIQNINADPQNPYYTLLLFNDQMVRYDLELFKRVDLTTDDRFIPNFAIEQSEDLHGGLYTRTIMKVKATLPSSLYSAIKVYDPDARIGFYLEKVHNGEKKGTISITFQDKENTGDDLLYPMNIQIDPEDKDFVITAKLFVQCNEVTTYSKSISYSLQSLAQKYLDDYSNDPSVIAHKRMLMQLAGN